GFTSTLPADKMHVTIAYSSTPMDPLAVGNQSPSYKQGVITGNSGRAVTQLGSEGAVVLKFASPVLATRWQQYRKAGASWDFEGYQPHITISYEAGGLDLSKVKPYMGPIQLGEELVSELDDSPGTPKEEPTSTSHQVRQNGAHGADQQAPAVRDMGRDEAALQQPERQGVPVVRGEGNQGVPGVVGELPAVPAGHGGAPNAEARTGTPGQQPGVPAGQRDLGDAP